MRSSVCGVQAYRQFFNKLLGEQQPKIQPLLAAARTKDGGGETGQGNVFRRTGTMRRSVAVLTQRCSAATRNCFTFCSGWRKEDGRDGFKQGEAGLRRFSETYGVLEKLRSLSRRTMRARKRESTIASVAAREPHQFCFGGYHSLGGHLECAAAVAAEVIGVEMDAGVAIRLPRASSATPRRLYRITRATSRSSVPA